MASNSICGTCVYYRHMLYYNWSSNDSPFITSMTICDHSSDGYKNRGYNCIVCANFIKKPPVPFFDYDEVVGNQLTIF